MFSDICTVNGHYGNLWEVVIAVIRIAVMIERTQGFKEENYGDDSNIFWTTFKHEEKKVARSDW